ncbi:MAG: D-sedoheptulose 7-phosphate isomerase [Bacteriovoracaceae bacterium]
MDSYILNSLKDGAATLDTFLNNKNNLDKISAAINYFTHTFKSGCKVFACGNGGSMCDSLHFTEELTGRYRKDRKALPAISMGEAGHMTCVGNDYGFDFIFSRQIEALGKENDTLLAISTSGNSPNVIEAVKAAKKLGMNTILLTGKDGGKLKNLVDVSIIVNSDITDRIQEVHIKIIHIFIEGIERNLFPENYK